jgi:uracil-DNA glycosylase
MKEDFLKEQIGEKWYNILSSYFNSIEGKNLFKTLRDFSNKGKVIYPHSEDLFRAFRLTPWNEVRIVILGQDRLTQYFRIFG